MFVKICIFLKFFRSPFSEFNFLYWPTKLFQVLQMSCITEFQRYVSGLKNLRNIETFFNFCTYQSFEALSYFWILSAFSG